MKSVLIVDDYESFRRFLKLTLQSRNDIRVVAEASDGIEAVHKAKELQPDLILLDIGLPKINGLEAARRIRDFSPNSKILIVSQERSVDIVQEALRVGASGYVLKSGAASDLLPAVNAVLEGKRFVSSSLGAQLSGPRHPQTGARLHSEKVATLTAVQKVRSAPQHEVGFYSDDRHFLDSVTPFIQAALTAGNAAIVVATESHREKLLMELQSSGLDIGAAIQQGRYIPLDAADTLSMFMVNGMPDPVRFLELLGDLIVTAGEAAEGANGRVSVFGECVNLLCQQGNAEAAIQMEKLGNKLTRIHAVDILCGYSLDSVEAGMEDHVFQQICAEHSAVCSR